MILVAGAAGYPGSHFVLTCHDAGLEVVALDDGSQGRRRIIPGAVPFHRGGCGDRSFVARLIEKYEIDVVVQFAACDAGPASHPLSLYEQAVADTRNLLAASVLGGVTRIIFASTEAAARADTGDRGPFGRAMLAAERMVEDVAAAHDLSYAVIRAPSLLGADPKLRSGPRGGSTGVDARLAALGARAATEPEIALMHPSDLCAVHLEAVSSLREGARTQILAEPTGTQIRGDRLQEALTRAHVRPAARIALNSAAGPTANGARFGDVDSMLATEIAWRNAEAAREAPRRAA